MTAQIIITYKLVVYICLFLTMFLRITDEKRRDYSVHIAKIILMFYSLFMSGYLIRLICIDHDFIVTHLYIFESITNTLFLILMMTKVKNDTIFKHEENNK